MAKTSETDLGLAVMSVLASRSDGEASIQDLVKHIPSYLSLSDEDRTTSEKRPNEEMWEQRVRNLKSHDKSPGNVIGEGFVQRVGMGLYRITEVGRLHLAQKGLLP